jgi:hypothetical protein
MRRVGLSTSGIIRHVKGSRPKVSDMSSAVVAVRGMKCGMADPGGISES